MVSEGGHLGVSTMQPFKPRRSAGRSMVQARWTLLVVFMLSLAVTACALVFFPQKAFASTVTSTVNTLPDGTIIRHSATLISRNQIVEDVVVFGHDVTVLGTVSDNLLVVNGNVNLGPQAHVGLVIDLGGQVITQPGAKLKNVMSFWLHGPIQNSAAVGAVGLVLVWVGRLMLSVLVVVVPVAVSFLLRPWLVPLQGYLKQSARRAGVIGLLSSLLVFGLALLFAVTIAGLPVSAVIMLSYVGVGFAGLSVASVWIGGLANRFQPSQQPVWLQSLIGATFLMAFMNVPLFGPLIFLAVWLLGYGAVSSWMIERAQQFRRNRSSK